MDDEKRGTTGEDGSGREAAKTVKQRHASADGMPPASHPKTLEASEADEGTRGFPSLPKTRGLSPLPGATLGAVKAVAGAPDEVEVLVPYGGPYGGADSDGDWFDEGTDFSIPGLPDLPRPVVEYHALYI